MSAVRREAVRWTLRDAECEFPVSKETLSKRLLKLGEQPGEDECFSTAQICAAVFGDLTGEKTRLAKEQADKFALDNAERRKTLIRVDDAVEIAQRFCHNIRQLFLRTSLPDEEKNALLKEVQRLAEADFASEVKEDEEDIGE